MLKASAVELFLSASDLEDFLAGYASGRIADLALSVGQGVAQVRLGISLRPLPAAVPVELRFQVLSVIGTEVRLGVEWANLPAVPAALKEKALQKAFEALPGDYRDGVFLIDTADLVEHLPVQFQLTGLTFVPGGVRVTLGQTAVYPVKVAGLAPPETAALVPVPSAEEACIPEHQSYYQRLRERMAGYARERAPGWAQPLVPWLLAVPDFFILTARLVGDDRVPPMAKAMAAAVVAYFITPVDLIPDLVPLMGQVDDLALAMLALEQIAERVPEEVVQEHWPGDGRVLSLVGEGSRMFSRALPARILVGLRRVLRRA